jgi:hypothetical protein
MKKFILIGFCLSLVGCLQQGQVAQIGGGDANYPPELKGLKFYNVGISEGSAVTIGVMPSCVSSVNTYREGKTTKSITILSGEKERVVSVDSIISETDDVIVIKKTKP